VVLSHWASMKRARVDRAATAIGSEKFREGGVEVIRNKWGNNVFFAIRNDEEMAGPNGIEVVLPSRSRVDSRLRTVGTGSLSFYVSIYCLCFQRISLGLLV